MPPFRFDLDETASFGPQTARVQRLHTRGRLTNRSPAGQQITDAMEPCA